MFRPALTSFPQSCAGRDLAVLGAPEAMGGLLLGAVRTVPAADVVGVAVQFAADGAGRPAEGLGDGADSSGVRNVFVVY